jgi:hypothetical protein
MEVFFTVVLTTVKGFFVRSEFFPQSGRELPP